MPSEPPLILGFDTSAGHCVAALLAGETVLAAHDEPMRRGQAERLLPMLAELVAEAGIDWPDLAALAVGTGPGNFTGLRLAVAAARGLALALGRPAIAVTRFEALAADTEGPALVIVEAPRDRLFVQAFRDAAAVGEPFATDIVGLRAPLPDSLCLGHRAGEVAVRLGLRAGSEATRPGAAAIARVARTRLGDPGPAPAPLYLRPPDAVAAAEPATLILDDA